MHLSYNYVLAYVLTYCGREDNINTDTEEDVQISVFSNTGIHMTFLKCLVSACLCCAWFNYRCVEKCQDTFQIIVLISLFACTVQQLPETPRLLETSVEQHHDVLECLNLHIE